MTLRTDTSYLQEISYRKRVLEVIPYFQRIHAYICDHVDIYTTAAESLGVKYVAAEGYANLQCFLILAPSGETAYVFVWGQLGNVLDKCAEGLLWGKRISLKIGKLFIQQQPILIAKSGLRSLIYIAPFMPHHGLNGSIFFDHVNAPINPIAYIRRREQEKIKMNFSGIRDVAIDNIATNIWTHSSVAEKFLMTKCTLGEALQRRTLQKLPFSKANPDGAGEGDIASAGLNPEIILQQPPCWDLFFWQHKWATEFKITTIEEHNEYFNKALDGVFVHPTVCTDM
ncbi:hypothetical protein RUND412_004587 [Rhizina undulata]